MATYLRRDLIIMIGIAGSGKSIFSENIIESLPTDQTGFIVSDKKSYKKSDKKKCFDDAMTYMSRGTNVVIIDGTNLAPLFFLPYLNFAKDFGYGVMFQYPMDGYLQYEDGKSYTKHEQFNMCVRNRSGGTKIISKDVISNMAEKFDEVRLFFNNSIMHNLSKIKNPAFWIEAIQNAYS